MPRDITIAISAKDNFSQAVTTMRNAGIHFNKNLEEMQLQLNEINKTRTTLKLDTKEAQKSLQAIQKEYAEALKQSKDGVVSEELLTRLDTANEEFERMRLNMGMLDKSARETERSMMNATGVFSKLESRAGGKGGAKDGLMTALAASGIAEMAKGLATSAANAWVQSAYGAEVGTMFSNAASGIFSGAAAGTMLGTSLAPGVGTAIGAAAGAGFGIANGALAISGQKDDVFRGVVQEQYNTIAARRAEELSAGTSIAGQRELDKIAFDKILKRDSAGTLEAVKTMANTTPFLYEDLKGITKTLATYGTTDPEEIQKRLAQIGDTGAALGMSTSDMSMVATGLGRMQSSGKTSLEYLNLLIERGIPAIDYLADAMDVSNGDVYDMVSKGLIPGAKAARLIADAMGEANSGAMADMAATYSGLMSTKEGLEAEMDAAMGEGHNEERKRGIEEQNAYLDPDSETGKSMIDAKRMMGMYQASLENAKEKAWRDAMDAARGLDEYKTAQAKYNAAEEAYLAAEESKAENRAAVMEEQKTIMAEQGAVMGEILAEAETNAITAYHDTTTYEKYEASQESIVNRLQSALADDYEHFGYEMGKEFTKGIQAAVGRENMEKALGITERFKSGEQTPEDIRGMYPTLRTDEEVETTLNAQKNTDSAYAYGLSYIPYNNYPAQLHEGERVLTAAEARGYKAGNGGVTIPKLADTIIVREDADIDRIAAELARKLREAQMLM